MPRLIPDLMSEKYNRWVAPNAVADFRGDDGDCLGLPGSINDHID
jgi:hypothetical protein